MDTLKRIELVNAYKKLLDMPLKSVSKDEAVQRQVQDEFLAFVNSQIESLMGGNITGTSEGFTSEEVQILKALINRSKTKMVKTEPTVPASTPTVRTQQAAPTERPRRERPAAPEGQPIGGRLRPRGNSQANALDELDRLDNEGPDY